MKYQTKILSLGLLSLLLTGCSLLPISHNSNNVSSSEVESQTSSEDSQTHSSVISSEYSENHISTSQNDSSSQEQSSLVTSEDDVVDLGVMTIKEVRDYISANPISVNSYGLGVDESHKVTIKGFALSRFDLVKTKASFGLDVSYPAKVMMGDDTGYIACASNNGDGSTLFGKVDKYAGQDTSRYEVTGYLSMYLGQPEIMVPDRSFTWNQDLDIKKDPEVYVKEEITLKDYYDLSKDMKYNCAGHGYGDFYKIKDLTCYEYNSSDGYYYMTDGERIVKVLKGTMTMSIGYKYDVIGSLSLSSYRPAFRGLTCKLVSSDGDAIDLSKAVTLSSADLLKIQTSQEDTDKRFDNFILSFGSVYKADVYMGAVTQSGKYDIVFSDNYQGDKALEGRDSAGTNKKVIFIDNTNFWGAEASEVEKYNGYYTNGYVFEEKIATVYYIPSLIRYVSKKPIWKVHLLSETIPEVIE